MSAEETAVVESARESWPMTPPVRWEKQKGAGWYLKDATGEPFLYVGRAGTSRGTGEQIEAALNHECPAERQRAVIAELVAVLEKRGRCSSCQGKGYIDHCRFCGDSTYDHNCEPERPCASCESKGAAPDVAAALARAREVLA